MVAGFLDNAQPIRLAYIGGLSYNLESLNQYVFGQAGSSIKAWMMLLVSKKFSVKNNPSVWFYGIFKVAKLKKDTNH